MERSDIRGLSSPHFAHAPCGLRSASVGWVKAPDVLWRPAEASRDATHHGCCRTAAGGSRRARPEATSGGCIPRISLTLHAGYGLPNTESPDSQRSGGRQLRAADPVPAGAVTPADLAP